MLDKTKDPAVHNGFWADTANLIDRYRKDGNEERAQGLVDARILFARYNYTEKKKVK